MHKFAVLIALMTCSSVLGAPSSPAEKAALRRLPAVLHEEVHDELGQFVLRYVTAEGTVVYQRGYLVHAPDGGLVMVIDGETSYVGEDGKTYVTKYHAGPDGVRVEGAHLPVAPQPQPIAAQ